MRMEAERALRQQRKTMRFEMAPMEGITTYIYRNAYARYFGGIDQYYTPFLSLHKEKEFSHKEKNEISPQNNEKTTVVPQVLTNSAEDFLKAAERLKAIGCKEININLGCPSGTVTAKGKGAGMLADAGRLDAFLDGIFTRSPMEISIKTRLGISDACEWDSLLAVYNRYPVKELIVHARVREDFYENKPDLASFAKALSESRSPVCYNGDIFCVQDYTELTGKFPALENIMLGRGLIADPYLPEKLRRAERGDEPPKPDARLLRAFHDEIYRGYQELMMEERSALFRMKELWTYLIRMFDAPDQYKKKLRKANGYADYEKAVDALFELELRQ